MGEWDKEPKRDTRKQGNEEKIMRYGDINRVSKRV